MKAIARIALGAGLLLCLTGIGDFSDRNPGLMIGIGCLIASVQIYLIGAVLRLAQAETDRPPQRRKPNDVRTAAARRKRRDAVTFRLVQRQTRTEAPRSAAAVPSAARDKAGEPAT